jgi:hypothetical protein
VKKILNPLFEFSAFLFPFALVLYLILFLLENVFPGFVSNIFDINYFLIPVLLFGFLAAFANKNENEDEKKPTRWDFTLIAGLVILSFVILLYKTADLGRMGFLISLISSLLVALISLIIIFPAKNLNLVTENQIEKKINYRKFLLSPFGISSVFLFLIIIIPVSFFAFSQKKLQQPPVKVAEVISTPIENPIVKSPGKTVLLKTPILILNGTGKPGTASAMANFLKQYEFGSVSVGSADNQNYKNALLQFNDENAAVASYITFLLTGKNKYKIVNMLPPINASQTGIILILGN